MKKITANYDFNDNELEILKYWEENNCFEKLLEKNKQGPKYRFIDGPITANNPMGIHHVWGRTLKDVFLRYKAMNGFISHYRNGFDGQGLWVEVEVEKELGFESKKDIEAYGLDKFTEACVGRVKKYADVITNQSKRLGQWMDWDNSYYTYTDHNITSIWAFLRKCHDNGWIKEIYRPLPWCSRCGTSLSDHEMTGSYKDVEHEAVFLKLPIKDLDSNILVWTTTPWTLSANVALAVNPDLTYVFVKFPSEDKPLIMAKDVFNNRFKKDNGEIIKEVKGTELENLEYETCFEELEVQNFPHKIVLWDQVDAEEGSGVVHIAPGCGAEDFDLGKEKNLEKIIPIDEYGNFYSNFGFLSGKNAQEVKEEVFKELDKRGKLYFTHMYKHSYPVCWRCKHEILFRLVKEWAIDVEELRPKLIENARKVKWYPEYQGKRMEDWLENMSDWNISRKRFYGLPLPFYSCDKCGLLTVVSSKEELKSLAINPEEVDNLKELHRPWIDSIKIKCPKCGQEVSRVPEVGDVWLDAGIVPFSTLKYFTDKEYWREYFPAEYVIEMKEQIRLWFYSMLFMSTVLEGVPPYESVGTYGMVTAEDGSKFSKTGFMIRFEDAAEKIGADASRYLYASSSPANDVRFGYSLGEEVRRKLLSFWNMIVFFNTYAELDRVDLTDYKPDINDLDITDKWLIKITDDLVKNTTDYMNNYNTKDVCALFEKYIDDVSNFYIRTNRRRFWKSEDSVDKKVAYYTLFNAIKKATQIIAPIIPFMSEYIWQNLIKKYERNNSESIHLSNWPQVSDYDVDNKVLTVIEKAREIITTALKIRNEKQIKVRQPLRTLYIEKNKELINEMQDIIGSELNVKEIVSIDNTDSLKDEYLTLNFKEAGAVLKGDVNKVKDLLASVNELDMKNYVSLVKEGKSIELDSYKLDGFLFNINQKSKENIEIANVNDYEIALDLTITETLKKEGIIRDIIRQCQVFRKEANFNVEDRILLSFVTDNQTIIEALTEYHDYIQNEMLATIEENIDAPEYIGKIEEDEYKIEVIMKRVK